jgi:ADP-ribosylglycohydrolase
MKRLATLVGCGIGDSLGNPFEMKKANSPLITEWDGSFKDGGTFWKGKAGQWTDDTMASICLAKSLIRCQKFDGADVASEYLAWYDSPNHRGMGSTTAEALFRLKTGMTWQESGITDTKKAGNGTAMRASPIGLAYRNDLPRLIEVAIQDASITHNSAEPKAASVAMALGVALLATEACTPVDVITFVAPVLPSTSVKERMVLADRLVKENASMEDAIAQLGAAGGLKGWAPETVGAAFYCLAKNTSFKDTVVMAVRCGGDTDTTAACAGALAGTYYGLDDIPSEYKDGVEEFALLDSLTQDLLNGVFQ